MAAISQTIFQMHFRERIFSIWNKTSPKGPNDTKPALVEIIAWRLLGNKPVSEPMLTRFTEACKS